MDLTDANTIPRARGLKPGSWHVDDVRMNNSLLDVAGVGPATALLLAEAGFTSVESIANAEPGAQAKVRGIGPVRAASLQSAAQRLPSGSEPVPTEVASDGPAKREKRAKKLREQAKQLRKQAKQLTKKAESSKSKKKRKRRLREAAQLEAAAKKARRKARKLASGDQKHAA